LTCFEKYGFSGCVIRTSRPAIESNSLVSCLAIGHLGAVYLYKIAS